jgi:hypothetical protein
MNVVDAAPVAVHLHQIAYSPATLAAVEPGYAVLDNLANPRPDWYEYWPLRAWWLDLQRGGAADEQAFYGFFSPKFGAKTQLTHAQAVAAVRHGAAAGADVVLFSPQPDMGAFFLNVFEQGETFDPGLIDAYEAFLRHIGLNVPLRTLVMDSRQIVFSNYFVARPAFWREWLRFNEPLFALCEGPDNELKAGLTVSTTYAAGAHRKVFLQERAASLILALQPWWKTFAANPFTMGWSASRLRENPTDAVISDALKLAWREQRFPEYIRAFADLRERFIAAGPAKA